MSVKVGDQGRYVMTLDEKNAGKGMEVSRIGRVIWIHPKGRFHLVEFSGPGWKLRECYPGTEAE